MANIQQELKLHKTTWTRFIKSSFWTAGACAIILLLLWFFLV